MLFVVLLSFPLLILQTYRRGSQVLRLGQEENVWT